MATFPATHTQAWYYDASDTGWSEISVAVIVRIRGRLFRDEVEGALNDLIARHASLRTTLHRTDAGVVQRIHDPAPVELPEAHLPSPLHDGQVAVAEEIAAPFLVHGGPLLRLRVVRIRPGESVLVINMHHSLCDGWSGGLLYRDLFEFYRARRQGRRAELSLLRVHMGDYAAWERRSVQQDVGPYWRERLSDGHPRLAYGRGAAVDEEPALLYVHALPALSPEVVARLEQLASASGTTLPRVLGAGITAAVAAYSESEITIRVVTANRHRPELRDVVGNLAEWLPVRVDLSGNPTFGELLVRFNGAVAGAYDHQFPSAGLFRVVRQNPQRRRGALFDVEVNFLDNAGRMDLAWNKGMELAVADEPWSQLGRTVVNRWHDELPVLSVLHERQRNGTITGLLFVNETAIARDAAMQLTRRVSIVVEKVSTQPSVRVNELKNVGG